MSKPKSPKPRNPIAVAMRDRYSRTTSVMRHRADRRPKDARRDWKNEEHS